jgi:uncharacterized membrane protein YhdT
MPGAERDWLYLLAGEREGPIADSGLRAMVRDGVLSPGSLVWTEGMAGWEAAGQVLPAYVGTPGSLALPDGTPMFFRVSVGKFVTMAVATFGLYEIYWSYRNWKYLRDSTGLKVSPFWRAWFVLFWNYELLRTIKTRGSAYAAIDYSAGWLTVVYLTLLVSGQLPYPLWIVSVFSFLPLLPVVRAIDAVNATAPDAHVSRQYSGGEIICLVLGGAWWLVLLYGYLGPSG